MCHQKINKKADRLYMKFSSNFNASVQRCLCPLFQNQNPHFLLLHLFRRMSQPSGFYHHFSKQKEITHLPQTKFFENIFFPSRDGEDYGAENTKIKLARILVTSFDIFRHFQALYFLSLFFCAII